LVLALAWRLRKTALQVSQTRVSRLSRAQWREWGHDFYVMVTNADGTQTALFAGAWHKEAIKKR
jgi:hypothetical protein